MARLEEVPAVFAKMMTRSADRVKDIKTAVFPGGWASNGHGSTRNGSGH
jgi:hypothetical protein